MFLFFLSTQLIIFARKYFQFLVQHLPVLLSLFAIIKILKLPKYLELLTLVSEKRSTPLHVQSKRNVSPVEEDIKKKKKKPTAVLSPTTSVGYCAIAK